MAAGTELELTMRARALMVKKIHDKNISLTSIAAAENLDESAIGRFLSGKIKRASFENISRMLRYLDIPMCAVVNPCYVPGELIPGRQNEVNRL